MQTDWGSGAFAGRGEGKGIGGEKKAHRFPGRREKSRDPGKSNSWGEKRKGGDALVCKSWEVGLFTKWKKRGGEEGEVH